MIIVDRGPEISPAIYNENKEIIEPRKSDPVSPKNTLAGGLL